ncbi:uncharacterized protein LOC119349889 isoform X3 [Triticum dicoccoides]|uniref:uncharacterized protein LOC119349889 isoform X3 n=1 Tax=Triticum dicoccoides TaxID=85692 RepID=UPI001890B233|nr:uncharacterized protein LOC119349889 isoform X3 [Triticum dicoccoides]
MIGDDDHPTTPPPSPPPPPPPPIAPAPSPSLGLGRRLLGSIRALSSAIALPSTPAAASSSSSSSPSLGLSLLLHLKPDLHLHHQEPPPPSTPASASASASLLRHHQDHDQEQDQAAPAHAPRAKRALHLLPQTPTTSPSLAPSAAAAAHAHGLGFSTQDQDGYDAVAVEGQEVLEQGGVVAAGIIGQGTQDATAVAVAVALDDDDQEKKPLGQCTSTTSSYCEELRTTTMETDVAKDDQEAVEQGVIVEQEGAPMDDAIAVDDDDQEEKPLEQSSTTYGDLGTAMENDAAAAAVQVQEQVVEQQDATQPRDEDTAAEGQETPGAHQPGSTENADDAVQVQEEGETADATAVHDHDKAVEQCTTADDLGTTMENDVAKDDQEVLEQGVIDQGDASTIDAVKDHEVLLLGAVEGTRATTDGIAAVEDQGKNVEQCTTYSDLGTTMKNDDAVDDKQVVKQGAVDLTMDDDASVEEQEVVEQGVVDLTMDDDASVEEQEVVEEGVVDLTMDDDASVEEQEVVEEGVVDLTMDDDDSVKHHKQQGIIDGTDDIAVEKQEKVLEQCSRATTDQYTVREKEMVVEQGVIDPKYMDLATEDQVKLSIIDDHGTVPMDNIVVKDQDKAVVQYASDAIVTIKDESPVEEHDTVGNQGVIDKNGRTKDDIDVEGHGYVNEQVIVDNWGTSSDATALEGQKNEAEPRIGDEQIAGKDMDGVHAEGNMLEQRTSDKQGATQSDFTVDKHKDVAECVRHEWGAPEDDLAMDRTAYQGTRDWGIVNKEKVKLPADDRAMDTAAYQGTGDWGIVNKDKVKLPEDDRAMDTAAYQGTGDWGIVSKEKYTLPARRYPQKPRKLNCPSYMSKGTCTYGPSCHFNHPPQLKSRSDESWRPSERRNHGAAEILELNRLGLPIREGARNCDYYMRTGACRYGKNCHFNHPDHVIDAQFSPPTGWEDNALQMEKSSDHTLDETSRMKKSSDGATFDDRSHMKKSSDDATLDDRSHLKKPSDGAIVDDTSYSKKSSDHENSSSSGVLPPSIFRMLLPPQKVLPGTEGKAKKKSDWSSDDSDGCCSADSSDGPLCKQGEHVDYPERPGRPEYHRPKQSKYKEEVNYPERPGKPDCPFYMRFGDCKFASACNYHHPKDKYPAGRPDEPECPFLMKRGYCKLRAQCKFYHPEASSPTDAKRSVTTDEHHPSTRTTLQDYMLPQQPQYPERPGQPECRYYLQFGKCKYLSACIFHHPKDRLAAHSDQIGPGMPDCPFYMKAGKCQFGSACEFRHPKDIHSSSTAEEAFDKRSGSGAYDSLTRSDNGVEQQEESIMYPERPGEPECNHYMRQGYCKFQMNCKYHHPGDRLSKKQYVLKSSAATT